MLIRWLQVFCSAALLTLSAPALSLAAPADQDKNTILVVGDSLSAEYGLARGSGWVAILETRIQADAPGYRFQNASISGDTTSGGLSRLPQALAQYKPRIVILELGANDALRGLSLQMTRDNLTRMIQLSQQAGAKVVLVGMQIPPNYGKRYTQEFRNLFHDLAREHQTALVPFLLDGMATDRSLFQADGIHPNEAAQTVLADNVEQALRPLLSATAGG